jgi:hypothetical protein
MLYRITRVALAASSVLLVASCAKSEAPATDTTTAAMAPAPAPAPAPLSLADVAGKWQFSNVPMSGTDTSPTNFVLTATADTTGWVMEFPSGLKVPLTVHPLGDSIHTIAGPFASQRRKSTKVTTETMFRMQDGKLVGTTTARYDTKGADSVLQLRGTGTRMP